MIVSGEVILHNFGALSGSIWAPFGTLLLHFGVQNRSWGCPAKVPKSRSETKRATAGNPQANGSKMGPRNRKVGGISDDFCNDFLEPFLRYNLNRFFDGFRIDVYIIFMLYLDVFGHLFETS